MRKSRKLPVLMTAGLAALILSCPVEAKPTFSGYTSLATEGVGRGFSVTLGKPFYAVGVSMEAGGWYASATVDRFEIADADHETYFIGGYARTFGKLTVDVSGVRYLYDSKAAADFWEGAIAVRHPLGPATVEVAARGSIDYFANSGRALYTYANVSAPLWRKGDTSVSMSARLGRQKVQKNDVLGSPDWHYWTTAVSLRHGPAVLDLGYHDTDIPRSLGLPAEPKLVAGLTFNF